MGDGGGNGEAVRGVAAPSAAGAVGAEGVGGGDRSTCRGVSDSGTDMNEALCIRGTQTAAPQKVKKWRLASVCGADHAP